MRDRDAKRNLVDWVVEQIVEINRRATDFALALEHVNTALERLSELGGQVSPDSEEFAALRREYLEALSERNERLNEAGEGLNEAIAITFRLRLRFGDEHSVVLAFDQWREAKRVWFDAISRAPEGTPTQEFADLNRAAGERLTVFLTVARGWMGGGEPDPFDASILE